MSGLESVSYRSVVFLCFADPIVEGLYARHHALGLAASELNLGRVHLLVAVLANVLAPTLPVKFWNLRAHVLYSFLLACYVGGTWCWRKHVTYLEWRETCVFFFRLVLCYVCAEANQGEIFWSEPAHGYQPYWRVLMFGSGAISNIWLCFSMPMRFRWDDRHKHSLSTETKPSKRAYSLIQ